MRKFKLIPVTIAFLGLMLAVKAADFVGFDWVQTAGASAPKKEEAKADKGEKKEAKDPQLKVPYATEKPKENIHEFTKSEQAVLEKLAARRDELDKREQELEVKEKLLEVSSKKLDAKLLELQQMKADTEKLLAQYNQHEDAKISGLVKMYEGMKPASAAAIMNEMEMEIVLQIINQMSPKKASPIMASMNPKRARVLTEQIALEKSLKEEQGKRNMELSDTEPQTM
jgi:flagellar motility protein MotE (MotC chaperone)